MQAFKDLVWNAVSDRLLSPVTLEKITDALLPLLHEKVIQYLSKGFDVHVQDVLRPKVGPKEEYVVYESTRPATLWFLIDLSDAREGDLFVIRLYIRLSSGEFLLRDEWEQENQRPMPLVTLSGQFAPAARLTITQVRGIGNKEVKYEVFGRYEGR